MKAQHASTEYQIVEANYRRDLQKDPTLLPPKCFYVETEQAEYLGCTLKEAMMVWQGYLGTDNSDVVRVGSHG